MSAPVKRVFNRAVKLYMEASTGAEVKVRPRPLLLNYICTSVQDKLMYMTRQDYEGLHKVELLVMSIFIETSG